MRLTLRLARMAREHQKSDYRPGMCHALAAALHEVRTDRLITRYEGQADLGLQAAARLLADIFPALGWKWDLVSESSPRSRGTPLLPLPNYLVDLPRASSLEGKRARLARWDKIIEHLEMEKRDGEEDN